MSSEGNNIKLNSIEEIIEDAKKGKMFILVDDENRENEGDIVIPAQFADANVINFMAKYGRGLICMPITEQKAKDLHLNLMSHNNMAQFKTAFTLSIEAAKGVSTGISAFDRAHTIATAINPNAKANDIVSPGHVFPIIAREGGVLVRAGHTEASVDIAKIAGLTPAAVICEIMKDDGTMARLDDLMIFAKEHDIKISTIAELISYRRKYENLIAKKSEYEIETEHGGKFKAIVYENKIDNVEHIALVKGSIDTSKPVLVRMHAINIMNDVVGDTYHNKQNDLTKSMEMINKNGTGVVVLLREFQKDLFSTEFNYRNIDKKIPNLRDYGIGAQILIDLKIHSLELLTNSKKQVVGLEGYGITIDKFREIS